jgi:hypothetical protein
MALLPGESLNPLRRVEMRVTTQNRELVLPGEGSDPDIMIWNRFPVALQFIAKKCVEDRRCGIDGKCLNIELKS